MSMPRVGSRGLLSLDESAVPGWSVTAPSEPAPELAQGRAWEGAG
jgi:hypothetical protein